MALKPSKFFRRHSFDALKTRKPNCVRSEKAVMGKAVKFEGISEELQKIIDADMDKVEARRRARDAFKDIQLSIDHCLFKMPHAGLKMKESYEVNSRGLEIFSKSWLPETSSPKATVYFCHGYGDTCTFFVEGIARKLASSGYGVFAMDYPGFGLSEGLHGFIPSFDKLVNDVIEHYSKVKENPEICNLPSFLFGQSMGGAVALKVHMKQPDAWNGAVLLAPMCKIADDMVPPWLVTQILVGIAKFLPKQKLVPQQDLAELAFRDVKKREQAAYNVIAYKHKPRLQTAVELLNTTQEIEKQLDKVSLPLLILHGENDRVTDPSISKALYEKGCQVQKLHLLLSQWEQQQFFRFIPSWLWLLKLNLQVYHDGLQNDIETRHSVSLCLLFCPVGILTLTSTPEKLQSCLQYSGFFQQKDRTDWLALECYKGNNKSLPFEIKYVDGIVQHASDSLNCGLFIAAYAEFLSDRLQVPSFGIVPESLRIRYASLLWNYGVIKAQNGYVSDNEDPKRLPRKNNIPPDQIFTTIE